MSAWTVPDSSSPQAPSTPKLGQYTPKFSSKSPNGFAKNPFASNPSTTPAGPLPSSVASFTPADPPPSSIFGSSQLGSGKTLFKSRKSSGANSSTGRSSNFLPSSSIEPERLARYLDKSNDFDLSNGNGASGKFAHGILKSSPPQDMLDDQDEESSEDESEGSMEATDDAGLAAKGPPNRQPSTNGHSFGHGLNTLPLPNGSLTNGKSIGLGSSILGGTPRGVKRSLGDSRSLNVLPRNAKRSTKPRYESAIPSIAKDMATQVGFAKLKERDEYISRTENILQRDLYHLDTPSERNDHTVQASLSRTSEKLNNLWRTLCNQDLATQSPKAEVYKGIGPNESAPPVHKAIFLGSLLLQLHHPPAAKGKQALALSSLRRSSLPLLNPPHTDDLPSNPTAFPKVLIDWLNINHDPYGAFSTEVKTFQPNSTAHYNYWDVIYSLTLRGRLAEVIHLLQRSDFHHAHTARDDRQDGDQYDVIQVRNITRVVNKAIQLLEQCPILQDDDWNVPGNEWTLFRKRVEQATEDLAVFAEGSDREMDSDESTFEASNFGLQRTKMSLSQSARKAESQVPWTVYQSLKTLYGILSGGMTEILAMAQDWVEAVVGLTAWWIGDDDETIAVGSVALTRRSLKESRSHGARLVDVNPQAAYLRRLASALGTVDAESSNEKGLAINTLNLVEVGLACVFEGNVQGAMGLLKGWSLPIASAIAEVASIDGWLETSTDGGVMSALDESDLLVLSTRVDTTTRISRDAILTQYADALSTRGLIAESIGEDPREGWEISISVISRLNDRVLASKKVNELLRRLPTDSDMQVDLILETCKRFNITDAARNIAEKYADYVIETSDNYGTALIYYARANRQEKVKDVLNLLISLSLVKSTAYPNSGALDPVLHSLISEPQRSLGRLSKVNAKAAELLRTFLTGYATLRRFYDLRDEEVRLKDNKKPLMRSHARKTAAATALIAIINSAADNIHGGLYDEKRGAIVQVDGLLALLGEAMLFVNQSDFLLSLSQCFSLLKAIEDLQTVNRRIYEECEKCFQATLAAYRGKKAPPSPRNMLHQNMLKKKTSDMTGSFSFSLVGNSMVQSGSSGFGDSMALVSSGGGEEKRGWDWRRGLEEGAKGEDVLRILRLGLAKDIAGHWLAGEGGS